MSLAVRSGITGIEYKQRLTRNHPEIRPNVNVVECRKEIIEILREQVPRFNRSTLNLLFERSV